MMAAGWYIWWCAVRLAVAAGFWGFTLRCCADMAMTGWQAPAWIVPESPEKLLSSIPMAIPTSTTFVKVPRYEGCYKFDIDKLLEVPVMDWKQHFEMGRQAATGKWKPPPDVPQVPAALPGPDLLAVKAVGEERIVPE